MRAILMLVLSAALLVGCKHPNPLGSAPMTGQTKAPKQAEKTAKQTKNAATQATLIAEPMGKVAFVNPALRFVVIDFALNPVPQADQHLGVYRQGQKVGVVKISHEASSPRTSLRVKPRSATKSGPNSRRWQAALRGLGCGGRPTEAKTRPSPFQSWRFPAAACA
jgi:hypothetical protein